jgi:hypothetical protein
MRRKCQKELIVAMLLTIIGAIRRNACRPDEMRRDKRKMESKRGKTAFQRGRTFPLKT